MTMIKIVLLLATFSISSVFAQVKNVPFRACGGTEIKSMTVSPCTEDPCAIPRGSSVKVEVEFIANQDADKIRHNVKALLSNGIPTGTFPGLKIDACKGGHIPCPVKKGELQKYAVDLKIMDFFPTVTANATFTLTGPEGPLMCATSPVHVV